MNPFRQMLRAHGAKPPIGTWVMSASPIVAEAVGSAGFEWGVIDMEHTPLDLMDLVHLLQAVGNTKMLPVVRVPWNDAVHVKRVLDAGAQTLMFPFVQSAEEARRAVSCSPMPPVKASTSSPPRQATSAPLSRTTRWVNSPMAKAAAGSVLARNVRMSAEMPDTPSSPDCL